MSHGISNSKILAKCDVKAGTVMFLSSLRKEKGTRGHNPTNRYALWRSPMRDARRQVGPISGRQWVKFRKFGQKAYKKFMEQKTLGGMIEPNTTD